MFEDLTWSRKADKVDDAPTRMRILEVLPTRILEQAFGHTQGSTCNLEVLVGLLASEYVRILDYPQQHEQTIFHGETTLTKAQRAPLGSARGDRSVNEQSIDSPEDSGQSKLWSKFIKNEGKELQESIVDQIKRERRTMKEMEQKHRQHQAYIQNLETGRQEWKVENDGLRRKIHNDQAQYEGRIRHLKEDIVQERRTHNNSLHTAEAEYKRRIQSLKRDHDEAMSRLENENGRQIDWQASQHRQEMSKITYDHAAVVQRDNDAFQIRINNMEVKFAEDLAKDAEDHLMKVQKLEEAHEQVIIKLRQDMSAMSELIFARDKFTPISDRDLAKRFEALVGDVRQLSMREWSADQPLFSDVDLKRVTPNPHLMRRDILQDNIWWVLCDHIFASPFRMFGEKGLSFEGQWTEAYDAANATEDEDFPWPIPTLKSEEFRYTTVKYCHLALKEPASELDPRAQVKLGFKEKRDTLVKAFRIIIEQISHLDHDTQLQIDRIVKKALNLWLDFGAQRCRLMIRMPSKRARWEEQLEDAEESGLVLTSVPELVRVGNGYGLDLHEQETIGGRFGETHTYSSQKGT